jgi:hypothetical protein
MLMNDVARGCDAWDLNINLKQQTERENKMRKLTYWVAKCIDDSDVYSIRAKTRKECLAAIANSGNIIGKDYEKPIKVTVEFKDPFDLLNDCLSESRCHWEYA